MHSLAEHGISSSKIIHSKNEILLTKFKDKQGQGKFYTLCRPEELVWMQNEWKF